MTSPSTHVLVILDGLKAANLFVSVDGGWGVDALLGCQTRPHDDLDLVIDIEQVDSVREALGALGYALKLEEMPTRFVLAADGDRRVDFHPNYLDETGFAHQRLPGGRVFTCRSAALGFRGFIDGREVHCLSPELQLAVHTGYALDEVDREDVARLFEEFALPPPPGYGAKTGDLG